MQWLESIGIYGKLSPEKFIPKQVFNLSKPLISLFLNRLFSCDGTIHKLNKESNNWSIEYSSSSKLLASQVQQLLLRFGVLSRLQAKKMKLNGKEFKAFELVAYGENVIKFIKEIGFFGEKELRQENALTDMLGINRNPNTDTIPREVWQSFKPASWISIGRVLGYSSPKSMHNTVRYAPSRDKLLRIAQVEENKGVQLLAESDIFWDEIIEAKELTGDFEVYDISVPEHHNFVANDIIVHNSYVLGVMAEELAIKNPNVGVIVIDPIGVFWSMKYPNKEERELKLLEDWKLKAQGLNNLKVFIPEGIKSQVPKETFNDTFAIPPSMLSADDWALTFGIDRFSPSGLLLDKVLRKVEQGFKTTNGKYVKAKNKSYEIDDLTDCLELEADINSRERGFKPDSVRALVSRLEAAKSWGIFSKEGTPLSELSREGQLTVIDTSFLEDNVTALVIGILARRILAARKIISRKEAVKQMKALRVDDLLELEIPPTWLFIDEAHTLIPSGNFKTPASNSLIEYVKQGRRPGCSLVFATQQPSAIDTKVLSQLDIVIAHKLIFDDDIKAVFKRIPSLTLRRFKKPSFIKTLPIGVALTADRAEETSRAFIMRIRPRMSQHEGREAEAVERNEALPEEKAEALINSLVLEKLKTERLIEIKSLSRLIDALNAKYKSKAMLSSVLDFLESEGLIVSPDKVALSEQDLQEEVKEAEELKEEKLEDSLEPEALKHEIRKHSMPSAAYALPAKVKEAEALKLVNAKRRKAFGLLASETVQELNFKYLPIYRLKIEAYGREEEFVSIDCFVNPLSREFIHLKNNKFVESKGFKALLDLNKTQINLLKEFNNNKKLSLDGLGKAAG
ncbi:DUF87 domain-containing protein, partial [archaeon]|nr:DUF87 domain-containing protein [archaeon]